MRLIKLIILLLAAFCIHKGGLAQNTTLNKNPYSYVVIGAFNFEENAISVTEEAKSLNLDAIYAWNPNRNLHYVFIYYSESKENAVERVLKLRNEHKRYADSWVYTGVLVGYDPKPGLTRDQDPGLDKTEGNKPAENVSPENRISNPDIPNDGIVPKTQSNINESDETEESGSVTDTEKNDNTAEVFMEEGASPESIPPPEKEPKIEEDYKVYVNAVNNLTKREVTGPVEILDNVREKVINRESTHKLFGQNDPANGSSTVDVVSRVFGYRPQQVTVNLKAPESDTSRFTYSHGDSVIVDLRLDRLQKGDLSVLWNVLFYKDAAIMRPESKGELFSLLDMLKERKDMNVMLHGHTNGNSRGKIIYLDEENPDFFNLKGDNREKRGSARKLSELRSVTIKKWLIAQGVNTDRIEIRGWGGRRMLHSKHDPKAFENVRVEVEVLN